MSVGSQRPQSQRLDPVALILLILGLIAAVLVRIPMLSYDSIDMIGHLKHWYDYIVLNGFFHALSDNFADYTPAYLTLIVIMAVLRERWLAAWMTKTTAIKIPSIAFDFALALGVYGILRQLGQSQRRAMLGAVLCLLLPPVVTNSALWGQADGMFTAGVVLAIWLLMAKRPALAAICWGFALAIKIQAIFIAPILFYLVLARRIRLWHIALSLIVFALGSLPSILAGRPAIEALTTYISQANLYHTLSFNGPNIWAMLSAIDYSVGVLTSVIATGLVCLAFLWVMANPMKRHTSLRPVTFDPPSNDDLLWAFLFSALAVPFLLAKMHDRYFFIADVLTLVIACRWPRYFWMPLLMQVASLNVYAYVLAGLSPLAWPTVLSTVGRSALLNLVVLLAIAWVVLRRAWPNAKPTRLLSGLIGSVALIGAIYFIGIQWGKNNPRPPSLVSNSPGGLSDPGFRPLSIQFGDELALVGYSMPQPRTFRMSNINFGLYFRPVRTIAKPYLIRVEAFNLDGSSLKLTNEAQPQEVPMTAWQPQQTFIESRFMTVWPETPALEIATLKVSILDPISKQALQTTCEGAPCDAKFGVQPIALDYTAVQPWLFAPALANFDPGLQLLHAQINPTPTVTSEGVAYDVEMVWRVSHTPLPQLVNFIHALDSNGQLVAQVDSEPNAGRYPTVAWHVGEVVIDHQQITFKHPLPSGQITLVTGWYERQTQARVAATNAAGQGLLNEVWRVGEIQVSQ